MVSSSEYQLLDFGDGRRLERFGPRVLDRPCPAADRLVRADPAAWSRADARFERRGPGEGQWIAAGELPSRWTIAFGRLAMELKLAGSGHVGVFPEQAANWQWIAEAVRAAGPIRLLNLFAYTGGSTLAAAAAGAEATHVDAARNVVAWARRNAERSGMAEIPVRWIAHDARKFVRNEIRNAAQYDAVVLDPPSYGRGTHGEVWRLSQHLLRLLEHCGQLTAGRRRFLLVTCHTPEFDAARLERMMAEAIDDGQPGRICSERLVLRDAAGRELPSGVAVRWEAAGP